MAQYTNVGGVARKVTKRYENIGGVAKNVLKAYNNVSGVARQYFASGIAWRKWSCTYIPGSDPVYVRGEHDSWAVGETSSTMLPLPGWLAGSYTFDSSYGFSYSGGSVAVEAFNASAAIGCYIVYSDMVFLVTGVYDDQLTYCFLNLEVVDVCKCYEDPAYCVKGSTDYGTVYAPEGDLPEEGTLVEGSATGDYCVIKVGSTYYYYERV